MTLFVLIAIMSLLNTFLPDFIRNYLKVSRFWRLRNEETEILQTELDAAREEVENVRNAEHAGEYAKTIKIMRAERKVNEIELKIKTAQQLETLKKSTIDTISYYVSKLVMTLILIIISVRNRTSPVMILDKQINLWPLEDLLSFPTGIDHAVSVPIWAFSCNFTFRIIRGLIKDLRA
ncbi:uncharacterized protein Dwil_GK17472 [Drosophila willistoni]|uniref:Uncharacterized protein n=1 Tax=Drosophila willistoni TaxID=7260 RepID=B4MMF1_DROWI|nr:guided entry of tail-anchored proteins factor 1 [Drosophila willistoni]EDW73296.1 uncharacterized protein Dwil_GK17472 [Drosophila willistoni]